MPFTSLFLGETTNPDTGAIVSRVWVRRDSGAPLKCLNSLSELKAFGSVEEVLSNLKLRDGQYGEYCSLPSVVVKQEVTW